MTLPPLPVRMPRKKAAAGPSSSSSSEETAAVALGTAATAFLQGAGIGASMMLFQALSDAVARSRSRRRLRRLQKQAWNPPLSHPLLRKAALVQQHEKACYEASTSFTVDADCCFEQTRRPSPAERAAAAAAAASAVLTSSDFPPAARARVAARWFAGAYSGVEPASVSSKTVTIAKEKKNEAVKKPAPAAKPAAATRPKSASRPASAASSRRNGGKRPASARSSRRPVSSSGSRT